MSKQREKLRSRRPFQVHRKSRPGRVALHLTVVALLGASGLPVPAQASQTKRALSDADAAVIDPEEVVDPDRTLKEHLTGEAMAPSGLCVLLGQEQRYLMGLPLRTEPTWQGCHGADHLPLEDKRFFSLVGRDDLWRRQRGRNLAFTALSLGSVAFVIAGVSAAIYGFAKSSEPGSGTWVATGVSIAIAGPSVLSVVQFILPLQTTKQPEAERLAFDYNQARAASRLVPPMGRVPGPGFTLPLVDVRF